ncbi:MAG TPA: glycosyltransferase family 4 protein, partial [Acidimicrobiia bacterium]|nr:glycosyltransferase family 4 protein [Acidimicrobiia bacterium]
VVIPYGVETSRRGVVAARKEVRDRLGIPQDATVAIWCGRIGSPEKRLDLLQRAISENPYVWWIVVGFFAPVHNQKETEWTAFASEHNVAWVKDALPWEVRQYYLASDFGASNSDHEGLALVIVETGAAGLPMVASDSGGSRYSVVSGATGKLIPPGEADKFVEAVGAMAARSERDRRQLGKNAAELVAARFSPATISARRFVEYAALAPDAMRPVRKRRRAPGHTVHPHHDGGTADKPLRIAFTSGTPAIGGLMWRMALTAWSLRARGHTVSMMYLADSAKPSVIPWLDSVGIPAAIVGRAGYHAALTEFAPDVVQLGWMPADGVTDLAPCVGLFAGPACADFMTPACDGVAKWICVAEAMRDLVPAQYQALATTIRNSVPEMTWRPSRREARAELGFGRHERIVLSTGTRLSDERKRASDVAAVAALVPEARFVLVGSGLNSLDGVDIRSGLTPWRDMALLRAAADLYFQSSKDEGLSIAAAEAARDGLPLVLSDAGGSRELAGNHATFPVGDVTAAAALIRELLDNDRCLAVGRATAARFAVDFAWTDYLAAYEAVYSEVVA